MDRDRIRPELLPLAHVINERVQQVAEAMSVKGEPLNLLDMGEILNFIQEQIVCFNYLPESEGGRLPYGEAFPEEVRILADQMIQIPLKLSDEGAHLEHLIIASVLVTMNLYMSRYTEPQ